jgi:thermostable 8-oxoguanine DNA glycosylase
MITPADIRDLRTASQDYDQTETLKTELWRRRKERDPFFLTAEELDTVFHWKLRSQYGRQTSIRRKNSDAAYRAVTEAVFKIAECDFGYESRVRLNLLTALPGIGIPVASAVLALIDPQRYCVIDYRGWRAVFCEERRSFSTSDYLRYSKEVARVAADLGWSVQETDLAIWEYDRRRSQRSKKPH